MGEKERKRGGGGGGARCWEHVLVGGREFSMHICRQNQNRNSKGGRDHITYSLIFSPLHFLLIFLSLYRYGIPSFLFFLFFFFMSYLFVFVKNDI